MVRQAHHAAELPPLVDSTAGARRPYNRGVRCAVAVASLAGEQHGPERARRAGEVESARGSVDT